MMACKNKVNPEDLEDWFMNNPGTVYIKSLEAAEEIMRSPDLNEKLFLEFYWEEKAYVHVFMKRDDMQNAMEKAITYFVREEMYEKAHKAQEIVNKIKGDIDK